MSDWALYYIAKKFKLSKKDILNSELFLFSLKRGTLTIMGSQLWTKFAIKFRVVAFVALHLDFCGRVTLDILQNICILFCSFAQYKEEKENTYFTTFSAL